MLAYRYATLHMRRFLLRAESFKAIGPLVYAKCAWSWTFHLTDTVVQLS